MLCSPLTLAWARSKNLISQIIHLLRSDANSLGLRSGFCSEESEPQGSWIQPKMAKAHEPSLSGLGVTSFLHHSCISCQGCQTIFLNIGRWYSIICLYQPLIRVFKNSESWDLRELTRKTYVVILFCLFSNMCFYIFRIVYAELGLSLSHHLLRRTPVTLD